MSSIRTLKKSTSSSAPEFTKKLENVTCSLGQSATLECCVRGYPAPEVSWEKAGEPLANSRIVKMERDGERCKLHIKSCTAKEAQVYSCVAVNKLGKALTTAALKLEGATDFNPRTRENRSDVSSTATKSPDANDTISQSKSCPLVKRTNGEAVAELKKRFSTPQPTKCVSMPKKLDLKPKKLDRSQFLKRPPTFLMPPHGKSVTEGETVKLTCSVSGEPEPSVSWEKGGQLLKSGDRYTFSNNDRLHCLEISDATLADAGSYVAILENAAGKMSASLYLEVVSVKTKSSNVSPETKKDFKPKGPSPLSKYNEKISEPEATNSPVVRSPQRPVKSKATVVPRIVNPLEKTRVSDGKPCTLSCEFFGATTVAWLKNGVAFDGHQDAQLSFDGKIAKLNIKEAFPEDQGQYTCMASNDAGKVETSCALQVNVLKRESRQPPTFTRNLQDMVQKDGSTVTFTAQLTGAQPIEVVWVHNANEVNDSPEFRHVVSEDGYTHSLVIGEIFPDDAGFYSCEAYNKYGDAVSTCKLTVEECESVVESNNKENKLVSHERRKSLQTSDSNKEERSSSKKVTAQNGDDDRSVLSLYARRNSYGVTNSNISEPDAERRKKSQNERETNDSPIPKILVTEEQKRGSTSTTRRTAPQIIKGPQSVAVLIGETVTLKSHFIGSPAPTVTWIKGSCVSSTSQGTILRNSERISISVQEGLTTIVIRRTISEDSGKYVVTVENDLGSDCLFASVSVEGVPDAPGEKPLVSDISDRSVCICWRGSPYDGGSVITGYVVEKCRLPDKRWLAASRASHTTSITIQDLAPKETYVFRVRAENVHGTSKPSPESDPVYTANELKEKVSDPVMITDKAMEMVEVEKGHLFTERFEVHESVGKGRFGVVFRCIEKQTGQTMAAKVIRCFKSKDRLKAREEAEIMSKLNHPKLLRLFGAFESAKEMTLVMEFISGGELFERVIADDFDLLERECILFMRQICEACKYMHQCKIMHLDLKPENILCETKTSHQIKIIDFGLAKMYNNDETIRVLFGTPEFVAPEVISYEPVGPFSDLWSVGVICYVLLTGLSPFMGDNDSETFTNITRAEYDFDDESFDAVSEDAKDFISQLFIKRPEKRMTASSCLRHNWLAKDQTQMSPVKLSTDKLKRFIIRRKWQKTGNAIRALGRMVNLSGVSTSPVSVQNSTADSDYGSSAYTGSLSSGRTERSAALRAKQEEDFSGESGVGDTDSVDSADSKWNPAFKD